MPGFDSFNTTPPEVVGEETPTQEEIVTDPNVVSDEKGEPITTETTTETNTETETKPKTEVTATETTQEETTEQVTPTEATPDKFFEDFNTRFNTQYKTDDDLKGLFELPKKVAQYETDLKDKAELVKSNDQLKIDLDNVRRTEANKYLSTPTMKKAFVADQLVAKFPDKDPNVLTELVLSDLSKMSDLDILAKELRIDNKEESLENLKAAILSDLNIDSEAPEEEWGVGKTRLKLKANAARANIKELTKGIELPKVETPEEVELKVSTAKSELTERAKPFKSEYSQFDKFDMGEGLEYVVPDDFKEKLGGMFDAFVDAGNEPTQENMALIKDIRDATFFSTHRKEILDAMRKDADTKAKAALDEKLNNTETPNTNTASDELNQSNENLEGMAKFRNDFGGQRATHI